MVRWLGVVAWMYMTQLPFLFLVMWISVKIVKE